jgi:hypothetical protein
MFIPEFLERVDVPGVSVYAEEPKYADDPTATRSEKLTFVFEAGGGFEIPAVDLDWWNTETSTIETASLPAITVNVIGPPVASPSAAGEKRELQPLRIAAIAVLLAIALWALRRILRFATARRAEKKKTVLASEQHAFAQLQNALAAGDSHRSYKCMLAWLRRLDGSPDPVQFAADFGDEALTENIQQLRASLYSGEAQEPDLKALSSSLANAYNAFHQAKRLAAATLLPALNP